MAIPGEGLALKGVKDCAILELLADSTSALTYDTYFNVTIQEFGLQPDIATAELPGNDVTLDRFAKAKGLKGTLKSAKIHHKFLAVLLGSGHSTTANTRHVHMVDTDLPKYFKIVVKIAYTGSSGTDVTIITVYKAKLESIEFTGNQDDYWTCNVNWAAVPTEWLDAAGKAQLMDMTTYNSNVTMVS